MNTNIIGVKYEDKYEPRVFTGGLYSYYTDVELNVGDIVKAPIRNGESIARVSRINILESEVEHIKSKMLTITKKINRDRFMDYNEVIEDVA